jgi:hypothetical protein
MGRTQPGILTKNTERLFGISLLYSLMDGSHAGGS